MIGKFNAENALNSIALVSSLGFNPKKASLALENYCGVERRQEIIYSSDDFILIDDFGHHPTAIRKTVDAIKYQYKKYKIIVIADLKSNSMKMGAHNEYLLDSFKNTDKTYLNTASINWKIKDVFNNRDEKFNFFRQDQKLIMALKQTNLSRKTIFLFFSNANNYKLKHSIISLLKKYEK
jgi:UDP-N-acetylmuramate: L-alanyl-gamma-D-glutamyl-meso-diaminopimelate ligase